MSTDPHIQPTHEDGNRAAIARDGGDADSTPTAEVPISVTVSTPSTVTAENGLPPPSQSSDGYFTSHPAASEVQRHPVITTSDPSAPNTTAITDHAAATRNSQIQDSTILLSLAQSDRGNLSSVSGDTSTIVHPPSSAPILRGPLQQRPEFPNQAYSALQSQRYPAPRATTLVRQRTAQPGQILTFTSALASLHQGGSRAVGNSAPVTPGGGLFTNRPLSLTAEWESNETPGTYASPFLHFTQRVPPKETHVADVDVDPISGRKLINHYEIIDELGRGTHGKVKLGRDLSSTDGKYVAIKIVERFSKRRKLGKLGTTEDKVKKEVAILKQIRHPNITALLEVIDDPSRKKVYIVLEWVERGQIEWRVKGPKEITMVEARRYEREKRGRVDPRLEAEDAAIVIEAQRRLSRQRKRKLRTFRRVRRDAPEAWSMELVGDDDSEISDDDMLSRISSESYSSLLLQSETRRLSRTPSPLPPLSADATSSSDTAVPYQSVTNEVQTQSPVSLTNMYTGLEGTMYGAYVPSVPGSGEHTRGSSDQSMANKQRAKASSDSLAHMAAEVLEGDLNDELEYVPIMSHQQTRVAFRDTLLGLQYLHYQGIIHRDIKPPNLLSTKEHRVKISDFGVSYLGRPMGENETGEGVSEHEAQDLDDGAKELAKTVGTPAFYAPELCITEAIEDAPPITKAIDVWALGVTLFCMLFARTPFVDNEFVVMRQIAEEEIYIPRKRLKPVEAKSRSRPGSQSRAFPPPASGRRNDLELAYEEIPDDLYDLLKRMLVKDPRKRITLEEVRHHPWVVADIYDKVKWLEETDPSLQSQGKKIEVSREDVNAAVVPLQFLDRVRSGIKKVGERLGFGVRPPTRGRARSIVNLANDVSPSPSATASTHASQDDLRPVLRDADASGSASTEAERPLSGVNPSAAQEIRDTLSRGTRSLAESSTGSERSDPTFLSQPSQDAKTSMATSGSVRTVKQSNYRHSRGEESPPHSPSLPETPVSVESPSGSSQGWARRILRTVRERSTARSTGSRASSSDRGSLPPLDTHSEPSLAASQATAVGHLYSPTGPDEFAVVSANSSARNSPSASRPLSSLISPPSDRLIPHGENGMLSRTSSTGSVSSLGRRALQNSNLRPVLSKQAIATGSSVEDWQRAEDEHIRKLIREGEAQREPHSPFVDRTCPPSPDDHRSTRSKSRAEDISHLDISNHDSSQETSPTGHAHLPAAMASSTSDLGSAVSISMSNPSIPSAISEASSMGSLHSMPLEEKSDLMSSGDTVDARSVRQVSDAYDDHPGEAIESATATDDDEDCYEDSSDSDGGLVMSRRKSASKAASTADPESPKERRRSSVSTRAKKSRSGSSNTMKKVGADDGEDHDDGVSAGQVDTS